MPRDLPLSNGSLLVNFDSAYTLRDVYYPYVGSENQTYGHPSRLGVWVENQFAWVGDEGWERNLRYKPDTLASDVTLTHRELGLEIKCSDVVDFHECALLRHLTVRDLAGRDREARLFFHHDFHLYENEVGDTAYFDPYTEAVIHYKDRRYMLMLGGTVRDGELKVGLDGYATGTKEVGGKQGTWRDAEDGALSGNPIAQGSVDSTVQINVQVPSGGSGEVYFWLAVAKDHSDVAALNERIKSKTPETMISRTEDYWRLWVGKDKTSYTSLPANVVEMFKRSLLIARTQVDEGGAIIAANDADIIQFARDTYSYMWPRDGALTANAFSMAGYENVPARLFTFCLQVISSHGYFLHKYNPDGSLASSWQPWVSADGRERQLPIQEDETALVLWAIWKHFVRMHEVEELKPLFRPVVIAGADFMVDYRDEATGLPLPSYDLWEERRGVSAFAVGAVFGGLTAAANLAAAFGEMESARRYEAAAEGIKAAVEKYLYDEQLGRFTRMVTLDEAGEAQRDPTVDASMYALWYFGMFAVDDPRITRTMQAIKETLWCDTAVGGLARYENDHYQRAPTPEGAKQCAGNPWFVCTMWYAQYLIAAANNEQELQRAFPLLEWAVQRALPSGVMAEQVNPYSGLPVSVSPLTWSHAAFITTVLEYLEKYERKATVDSQPS